MAERRPLVIVNGRIEELSTSDTLPAGQSEELLYNADVSFSTGASAFTFDLSGGTYEILRFMMRDLSPTSDTNLQLNFRVGATNRTSSYGWALNGSNASGTAVSGSSGGLAASFIQLNATSIESGNSGGLVDVSLTLGGASDRAACLVSSAYWNSAASFEHVRGGGSRDVIEAIDGFRLVASAGTLSARMVITGRKS